MEEPRISVPKEVADLLERLEQAGFEAYLVGGCVRDHRMGRLPRDYDITTSAFPDEMKRVFLGERVLETGLKHGTLTVLTSAGGVEITTYREDGPYTDHRHPDGVSFTRSLREDLARRDFTVNAMAMDRQGNLIDLFGGEADLEAGILRCVGDPCRRFEEDALRILRALRFAARFGFAIEEATAVAMEEKCRLLNLIAKERIFAELSEFVTAPHFRAVWEKHSAVLQAVLPELSPDLLPQALVRASGVPMELDLRLAALLAETPAAEILMRLRTSSALRKETEALIREAAVPCPKSRVEVHLRMARCGAERFFKVITLWCAADPQTDGDYYRTTAQELLGEGACLSLKDLTVNGQDLATLGLSGAAIGTRLEQLFLAVIRGEVENKREALLEKEKEL